MRRHTALQRVVGHIQGGRWLWTVAALIHGVALLLYLDWSEIVTNPPVADTDFATHWAETWSVSHYLSDGHLWGYDPSFMAGYPSGVLYDLDNKLIEVSSWSLSTTGLSLESSYNLVLVTLVVLAPLCVYPAARWLGLGRVDGFVAQVAALCLWYFDPKLQWSWQGGTFAFAAAVFVSLLVLAAAFRLACEAEDIGVAPYLVWFVVGPAIFWLHAFSFLLLLVPLAVLTLSRWHTIGRAQRLLLGVWPPLVIAVNLPWLLPSFRFLDTRTASDDFLQGGMPVLAADLFGIGNIDGASEPGLLGLRWSVLVLGAIGMLSLGRTGNVGVWSVAAGAWFGLVLAYGAVSVPGGGDLQPYRYIEQAMVWSTVGLAAGGRWVLRLLLQTRSGRTSVAVRGAAATVGVLLVFWIGSGAWPSRPPQLGGPAYHQWRGPGPDAKAVCDYLSAASAESGRVLVDDWRLGAILPWCSGMEVIGGPFLHFSMDYGHANTTPWSFAGVSYEDITETGWRASIRIYRVRWLVIQQQFSSEWFTLGDWLDGRSGQARHVAEFGDYQIWQVPLTETGVRVRADHSGMTVASVPADQNVVLPYHWVPGLETMPRTARVEPVYLGNDPVPFIRVRSSGADPVRICLRSPCETPERTGWISSYAADRRR